jgi:drug/metabolite transporter (DMT)-like permease
MLYQYFVFVNFCYTSAMRKRKTSLNGIEALFVAAFFYAGTNALVRYMSPMWGNQAQVFARFATAGLILFGVNRIRKAKTRKSLKGKTNLAVVLSILQAVAILFYTLSVLKTTIANMLFVSYATTMIVQFTLGTIFLREKVNIVKLLAIAFSLAGLALYSHALLKGNVGILFAVLAGTTGAFANVVNKKLAGVDRWSVLEVQYGLGALILLVVTLVMGGSFVKTVSLHGILITIAFALAILIASYLLLYGYQHIDVNIGTVISSTELVLGVLIGLALFHEIPSVRETISGLLIASGSVIGAMGQKRMEN